jgi:hypothetical protein
LPQSPVETATASKPQPASPAEFPILNVGRKEQAAPLSGDKFLVLRSDWLNPDLDMSKLLACEDDSPTAADRQETGASDPRLAIHSISPAEEQAEIASKSEVASADDVITLSKFLDPKTRAPNTPPKVESLPEAGAVIPIAMDGMPRVFNGRDEAANSPRPSPSLRAGRVNCPTSETDAVPSAGPAPVPAPPTEAASSKTGTEVAELAAPLPPADAPPPSSGPVSVREEPALDWLPASDLPAAQPAERAAAVALVLGWLSQRSSKQALVGGVLLVLCGLVLFGVSFRRV